MTYNQNGTKNSNPICTKVNGCRSVAEWKPCTFTANDSFIRGKLDEIRSNVARLSGRRTLAGRLSRLRIPYRPSVEKAIYLHYPNYRGGVEGDKGIMKRMLGNTTFPVGHCAVVTLDEFGNAKYFEYGRYNKKDKNVIGRTVRGNGETIFGNVRQFKIPSKRTPFENDSVYIQRIRPVLPYNSSGVVHATIYEQANAARINRGFRSLALNGYRRDYSLSPANKYIRTCATVANDMLRQGFTNHTIKTYLENLYPKNNKGRMHLYNRSAYTFFNPWSSGRLYNSMEMFGDKSYIFK